jgi:5'-nucleotidase
MFYKDRYKLVEKLPNYGGRYVIDGQYQERGEEGTDLKALIDKCISIGVVNNIGV